jgi:hypothetical protein
LAFEYIKRKPENTYYLVNAIKSSLIFNKDDAHSGFIRQEELFNIITKDDQLYYSVFLNIVNLFLEDEFRISKDGKNFTITIYNYRLPSGDTIKNIRKKYGILFTISLIFSPMHVSKYLKHTIRKEIEKM